MSILNNSTIYSLRTAENTEAEYTEIDLDFFIKKVETDATRLITSYDDDNNHVKIIRFNNNNTRFILVDAVFNRVLLSVMKNLRYDNTKPFGIKMDIKDNRNQGVEVRIYTIYR